MRFNASQVSQYLSINYLCMEFWVTNICYLANLASCVVISTIFFISWPIGEKACPNIICSTPIALIWLMSVPIWSMVPLIRNLCCADEEEESITVGYVNANI